MDKILIYSKNGNILIVGNANNVDLINEYYSLIKDIPYPKKDFSYNIANPENCILSMTIQKNRFIFVIDTRWNNKRTVYPIDCFFLLLYCTLHITLYAACLYLFKIKIKIEQ